MRAARADAHETNGGSNVTLVRYELTKPNPSAERPAGRKQGSIRGLVGTEEVCSLSFGLGPGDGLVAITEVRTDPGFQRQGLATGLVRELQAAYPDCRIEDGFGDNTCAGNNFLASMRALGLVQ
jgi:ribosomal protein S18 acetylase RimI-like enzyme